MELLSPHQIVDELDKYIIGQDKAKRAVANALRSRYRRSKIPKEIMEDVTPKNIILKGPTGVGKTEIARRLAKMVKAPFIKVEATKFTEVGYVGRDVESIIRDLVEVSIRLVKEEKYQEVKEKTTGVVNNKLIDILTENRHHRLPDMDKQELKKQVVEEFNAGKLENEIVEIEIAQSAKPIEIAPGMGAMDLGDIFGGMFPSRKKLKKMSVANAREIMLNEESDKFVDMDNVNAEAIRRCEQEGIVFIDEIDKIAGGNAKNNPDVSREGVQRDILPIVEGCTVSTKYGTVKTDYILFIASGAFHISKIEDLIPELLGRFPIQVELQNLSKDDFVKILTATKNNITIQYKELLKVDNVDLEFTESGIDAIADLAVKENETSENIGARRLHTIMENLLDNVSFHADGTHPLTKVVIDKDFVEKEMGNVIRKFDLTKYLL